MSAAAERKDARIRAYQPDDRAGVRALCCRTGFLGDPIDPVFEDRELFANFLTGYYLRSEPEAALVVEVDREIKGYLISALQPWRHRFYSVAQATGDALRALHRYPRYRPESRRYLHWMILQAHQEVPPAPHNIGHFHLNLLPEVRSVEVCRALLLRFFQLLRSRKVPQIYAQVVTFNGRRGTKFFERYGFTVLNRSEITKYRRFTERRVYLSTVLKKMDDRADRLLSQIDDLS